MHVYGHGLKGRLDTRMANTPHSSWASRAWFSAGRAERPSAQSAQRFLLSKIQERLSAGPIRLTLWDGTELTTAQGSPVATVLIKDRPTLLRLVWHPDLYFGEAYSTGRVEVEGDLVALLEIVYRSHRRVKPTLVARFYDALRERSNTLDGSRRNIHPHYDIGNDFYRLWLDEQLLYTCAYFPTPAVSLEQAQEAKLDYVCRKLGLRPGERIVEAGCGWGALALHMAQHHGVTVRAFNISREQVKYAKTLAIKRGLDNRVEFIEDDYRNVRGRFDVFVSIGMLEHVGLDHYGSLGLVMERSLDRARGRGLLHFIGRNRPYPLNPWITTRIFPGAYPPTLREVMSDILEPNDFSVLDIENLRLHYAKTLEHWRTRYENASDKVRAMFDEQFVRSWRLYLAGSQAAFSAGALQLFQVTFARGRSNDVPWTRAALYEADSDRTSHGTV